MGAGSGPPGRAARGWRGHVQRTPRKPRASWPRCKEPWKRATGKKIKRSLAETEQRRERGYNSLLILAGSRRRWEPAISLGCEPWGCEAAGGRGGGRNLLPALSRPHPCPLCCCSPGQDSWRGYSGKKIMQWPEVPDGEAPMAREVDSPRGVSKPCCFVF